MKISNKKAGYALVFWFFTKLGFINASPLEMNRYELPKELQAETSSLNSNYLIFNSKNIDSQSQKPLLIFLHGGGKGGNGDDILKFKNFGESKIFGALKKPILLLIPQALKKAKEGGKGVWRSADLNILLNHVKAKNPKIDPKRIYLTGISMGGYGTWMWSSANPEHFAAIIPICGGLGEKGPKHITKNIELWKSKLVNLPIWAFHGEKDTVVPVNRTTDMIHSIRAKGSSVAKMSLFPDKGHNLGKDLYKTNGLIEWMLQQSK